MYKTLAPGALGMKVGLREGVMLAKAAGFAGLEFSVAEATQIAANEGRDALWQIFTDAGITPAAWPMPVEYRKDDALFLEGLNILPAQVATAAFLGSDRTFTWIMPCSDTRTFDENYRFHVERFKPISELLGEHGVRFGLEFIGPKTLRESQKYPFIHKMEDMLELCADIGPNIGLLLDCWHWHTSGGTLEDLLALRPEQIVYVHVNDAPTGVSMDAFVDNQRALPGATGVIDIAGFLGALNTIGYDGPVTPEPFGNPATWARQSLDLVWKEAGFAGC